MLRRHYLVLTVTVFVLLYAIEGWTPHQRAAGETTPPNQVIGSWRVKTDVSATGFAPALISITSDGTFLQFDPNGQTTMGSWTRLTDRAVQLTAYSYGDPAHDGCDGGRKLGGVAEAGDAGEQITMVYTLQCFDLVGSQLSERGPITASGSRIAVDPIPQPVATVLTP